MTLPVTDASMGPLNKPFLIRANSARISAVNTRDTLIASEPCRIHPAYRNRADAYVPYKPVLDGTAASLHDLVCRWAVDEDLSIDSTRLPRYVRVISDTLRLAEDAFAYAVRMIPTEDAPSYVPNNIFFVGQVGDSLYYRDFGDERPDSRNPSRITIRDMRFMDVPGAKTQYFWVETEVNSTHVSSDRDTTEWTSWKGHILTYDASRGIRYLQSSSVRGEKYVNGEFQGMEQWDVSVPEPGIMVVTVRERKGTMRWAPLDQLGRHVIDPGAVSNEQDH